MAERRTRPTRAFFVATLAATLVIAIAAGATFRALSAIPLAFLIAYVPVAGIGAACGGPLYLLAKRLDRIRWWTAVPTGILAGEVVPVLMLANQKAPSGDALQFAALLGVAGAIGGLVFRLCLYARVSPPAPSSAAR
jgi:hypothetical protein